MASNSAFRSSHRSERPIPPPQPSSSASRPRSSRPASTRRSVLSASRPSSHFNTHNEDDADPGRVRVAVRLRPRNAEDLSSDADFADCVEVQPELNRLKLKKNNWSSEAFKFDEVFTESASQKRVYEAVAKPVVESVLDGYNGTVMAYGQTGTGKTYTVGRLGKDDPSERGIMVRALEDIIAGTSPASDTVAISYLQLYLESIQDLLAPEKNNIPIVEDPKTGEVSLPGVSIIKVRDLDHCLLLLQIGEANRHASNTKLNTESSRSHAILMVYIQKPSKGKVENELSTLANSTGNDLPGGDGVPVVLKSKLLIVDLAGSERIDKSGSDGHMFEEAKFINLSLTSLGKCINALAENSPHIPTRESKLTRLLRDSFGGSARTSLVVTIWPSVRHHAETSSTIMFGQRAMKVVNTIRLKEEFDYESQCRKLECHVDYLTAEIERQQKLRETDKEEMEKKVEECQNSLVEAEKSFAAKSESLEKENICLGLEIKTMLDELNLQKDQSDHMCDELARLEMSLRQTENQLDTFTYQKVLADTTQMYEKKIAELLQRIEDEHSRSESAQEELSEVKILLSDHQRSLQIKGQKEINDLELKLQEMHQLHKKAVNELESLKTENEELLSGKEMLYEELRTALKRLSDEEKQRKCLEDEIVNLKKPVAENNFDVEAKKSYMKENSGRVNSGHMSLLYSNQSRETLSGHKGTIAKIFEEVGLQKMLSLLRSEDLDVQIHAAKVVANLAAEDINQEKIVEEGGLDSLLMLLGSSGNATIQRVASGAIANLAMNEMNQGLIMSKGGARLLANVASKTDDPQTLRMVAGAIANLCGNEKLHVMLKEDGGTKALLGMVGCGHLDVIAQIARGMANFAKCESRGIKQGHKKGRSFLIEDGALTWMIANCSTTPSSSRRHIELALCHLAQNKDNAQDFISSGALEELIRISRESSREDIRNLARKSLNMNPTFLEEMQRA
ncbi:kinesin-like protein KIN-UA isoform X2 [Magnolia sinica]|uniref:kinesin-like protein KIN-UA isoform X2 n=1 Tax=Magnolia sinica TaxID=86752 RepID=UPI0026597BAB|nr:kinesin-like protein KIN-UA isoform X2 [Magnolia sinica]